MSASKAFENKVGATAVGGVLQSSEADNVAKALFVRLDPILRMLLAYLEQYKELLETPTAPEERILGFLRAQTKLLETLQQSLMAIVIEDKRPERSAGLVLMADYILLPILIILERQQVLPQNEAIEMERRKLLVRQSVDRKCVESAANTLSTYVRCIQQGQDESVGSKRGIDGATRTESTIVSLPPKTVVRCLVACSVALPMGSSDKHDETGVGKLDKGEECTMAVLQCVESLVSANASTNTKQILSTEIINALQGALMARMVHCCISLLTPETDSPVGSLKKANVALCLQCLTTLQSLMVNVPVVATWRAVFPGCFAGLYRFTLSQMRLSPSSSNGTVESLKTLSQLLCLSMKRPRQSAKEVCSINLLDEIRLLATPQNADKERKTEEGDQMVSASPSNQTADESFANEVNARLPAPLTMLMSILPVSQSPLVRLAATKFCRAILVDAGGLWTRDVSNSLELKAMECCLVLLRDKDALVESSSRTALHDYQLAVGTAHWPDHLNRLVVPRVVNILEELPALSRSRREVELRSRLQLIGGYLSLATNDLSDSRRSVSHTKAMGRSLAAESVSSLMRKTLTDLFDVDFDSLQYSSAITSAAVVEDALVVSSPQSLQLRFSYMSDESRASAELVVRGFGRALGQKHAALFVDACIADLLDSRTSFNPKEQSHVAWLHQWIGSVIVANEVLVGAFGESPRIPLPRERKERKQKRLLHSLASSVLPVITSGPLWEFPTIGTFDLDAAEKKVVTQARLLQIDLNVLRSDTRAPGPSRELDTSASALRGNASLCCSMIRLIESFARFLGNDTETFLPVILYPLFEKASINNHSEVQRTAVQALNKVAAVCGMSDIPDLVENSSDYLYGAMLNQVRTQGRRYSIYPVSLPGVVEIVLRNSFNPKATRDKGETLSLKQRTNISHVIEIVGALVESFDHRLAILPRNTAYQTMIYFELARMCDAAMCYFLRCYEMATPPKSGVNDESGRTDPPRIPASPWLSVLAPFDNGNNEDEESLTPEEGFTRHHMHISKAKAEESSSSRSTATSSEIDFVNLVLARSCFFLSSNSLKVQVASCDTLLHAFEFLGSVSNVDEPSEDENTGTAILQSISESWPAIRARLSTAATTVLQREGSDAITLRTMGMKTAWTHDDDVAQESFLCKLLDLIAAMCELSGDFMVSRFKDDVWPLVAQLVGSCAGTVTRRKNLHRNDREISNSTKASRETPNSANVDLLLIKFLNFLSKGYKSKCGQGLAEFIPIAGTMILPLLDVEGGVRTVALETLKSMLKTDCDSLWRALLTLSGRGLPSRPLNSQSVRDSPGFNNRELTLQMKGAQELVDFVESLPEQPLY